jgi:hypothetical protein
MREHGVAESDCERASYAFDLLVRNVRISSRIWALSARLVENDRPGVCRGAPLAHLVVALELLSLLRRCLTVPLTAD